MNRRTRYRWYQISSLNVKTLSKVVESLQERTYGTENSIGYKLELVRRDRISGSLIKRREYDESVSSPFGEAVRVHRIVFDSIRFLASIKDQFLIIENPGTLSKTLVADIGGASDYSLSIAPIEIDPVDWVAAVKEPKDSCEISCVKTKPFPLLVSVSGMMRITGSSNVVEVLKKLPFACKASISSMLIDFKRDNFEFRAELRSSGVAVIHKGNADDAVEFLTGGLRNLMSAYND